MIESDFELAEWFRLSLARLQWFADTRGIERTTQREPLRHYRYRPLTKRFGRVRLIESPKPQLKLLQRLVLQEFLERLPPHDAAHGFRRGRSICTNAAAHLGRRVVVRMDLEDFFPSITVARVRAVFRAAGYNEEVATLLAGLCTNSSPSRIWNELPLDRGGNLQAVRYTAPHLPQGAPTSPALANLVAYRLDCRLQGLAATAGARYTRYADDLAFSGDAAFARGAGPFVARVAATAIDEGFALNYRKTRTMHQGVRQEITGVVVNQRPNVRRDEYEQLKATLHNCIRHGAASQNHARMSHWKLHLTGRVVQVAMLNPQRGARLKTMLQQIEW